MRPAGTVILIRAQERLRAYRQAVDGAARSKQLAGAVDLGLARELFIYEDNLNMTLAPFLHQRRCACRSLARLRPTLLTPLPSCTGRHTALACPVHAGFWSLSRPESHA